MSNSRRPVIAGNWKMNGLVAEGEALAFELVSKMLGAEKPEIDMLVCPPFTLVSKIANIVRNSEISLGAQDCHEEKFGAHTGDVSAAMLKDLGCECVIVGHSERRTDRGDTDELVRRKAESAFAENMFAIICVGETEAQRNAGETTAVVRNQVRGSVPEGSTSDNTIIAYEPVWAIGTGRTPTLNEVQEVHALIRAELGGIVGAHAAAIRILYGGSMKPENAKDLIALADVDGGLIGGASLKAEDFWAICDCCQKQSKGEISW
jgi:triosephosphate isomerase